MENCLREINFKGAVLHYADPIVPMNPVPESSQYKCLSFCCECERRGLCNRSGGAGVLMSHGCAGEDIAQALNEAMPQSLTDARVMFLFENPGGDYNLGIPLTVEDREIGTVTKKPPVGHYYWTMQGDRWPTETSDVVIGYGDYIAHLIYNYGLSNVYVTNCVKCKYGGSEYSKTALCCVDHILKREISAFKPEIIFCFGLRAYKLLSILGPLSAKSVICLLHPAQRRYSRKRYYEINQSRIEGCGLRRRTFKS